MIYKMFRYMRAVSCILLTFFIGICWGQPSSDTMRIMSHQKFGKIPTCIGHTCLALKSDSTEVQGDYYSSYRLYNNVTIGKIKKCRMIWEIPYGICLKMSLFLDDVESVEQAGKQASKQFGKPVYSKDGSKYIYAWKYTTSDRRKLNIRLEVAADQKHGMLYIDEQV